MKAAQIKQYGGTEVIEVVTDVANPVVQAGQVLVQVYAASLNRIDSMIRAGFLQQMMPLTFPSTVGGDFAGVITEVGDGITDLKIGDEVYGQAGVLMGGSGSFAEFVVVPSGKVAKKPSIDMVQAASLPLVGTSAVQAIEEHINIQNGQKILIHGGTGGIGSLAIQIAKVHNAYVTTTVSSGEIEMAKQLGADEVIDYKKQDFASMVKEYDAVFVTAADALAGSYQVLKKGGILVAMTGQVDNALAQERGITAIAQMTQASSAQLKRLAELVDSGKLKPVVDKTFTLDETKAAFDYFEQRHPKGKVVVTI